MFDIKEETSIDTLEECYTLCESHFYELEMGKTFDVDWFSLERYLEAKVLTIVTARLDGVIVGYYMSILSKDFMTSQLNSRELAIYVSPEYRGGRLFLKLSNYNTKLMRSKGVVNLDITFMIGHDETLPLRLGFKPLEVTYRKVIGES